MYIKDLNPGILGSLTYMYFCLFAFLILYTDQKCSHFIERMLLCCKVDIQKGPILTSDLMFMLAINDLINVRNDLLILGLFFKLTVMSEGQDDLFFSHLNSTILEGFPVRF